MQCNVILRLVSMLFSDNHACSGASVKVYAVQIILSHTPKSSETSIRLVSFLTSCTNFNLKTEQDPDLKNIEPKWNR